MATLSIPVSDKDHTQGDPNAPITLVEYSDFQCPSCGQAYPVVKRLQKHFGKRLRFVYRQFPLFEMHPQAESAAEVSEFAAAQSAEAFWEMHDDLFEHQETLGGELYAQLAQDLELDPTELHKALQSHKYKKIVAAQRAGGEESDVQGTPTFYINGRQHKGSYDYDTLREALENTSA